jgi:hypothetical protein
MKEKLKCLCALIYGAHFERVDACVERLEACERALRQHQSGRYMREKQPLMMSTPMEDYSVKLNPNHQRSTFFVLKILIL